jgi:hypothetical protein
MQSTSQAPILNQLAGQPELLGGGLGGALGATQGETPEERARNALLGAAGGAIGGRLASRAAIDRTRMGSNLGNIPKPVQKAQAQGYEGADIGEAQEWVSARSKGLDMSQPARMQRAQEMGFNTERVLYHGTDASFDKFKRSEKGKLGQGIYFASNEKTAQKYGNITYPVYIKGRIATAQERDAASEITRGKASSVQDWKAQTNRILEENGFSGVQIHDEILIFSPSNIRSVNAAFDPAKTSSANILAGVGAVGAGAAMMPRDQKKPPGQRPRG